MSAAEPGAARTGEADDRPPVRRHAKRAPKARRRFNDWPILIVLVGISAGLTYTGMHHFKRGSVIVGAFVCLAALLRLVLPQRLVGLLAVRGRVVDVSIMFALGLAIAVVTYFVPPPE
ncbi:MAG: DUF3017 domain-containing protein [Streptosporangiales bacterium]